MYRKNTVQKRTTYRIGLYKHISYNQYIISAVNRLVCSKQINWVNHSIGQHHPTLFVNTFYIQTAIFKKKADIELRGETTDIGTGF